MSWRHIVPSLFTAVALLAGFFSMVASASGEFTLAAQLILLSLLLDGIDGTLARMLKGTTQIGAEFDTFVDLTSFGLAPALLLFELVLKDVGTLGLLMTSAIVLSGTYRLSRFRVVDPHRGQRGYLGLPITNAAGWIAIFVIATQSDYIDQDWFCLTHGPMAAFFWTTTLLFILLQVSHVRYGKPTKNPMVFIPFSVLLILLFSKTPLIVVAAALLSVYAFIYGFISPIFYRQHLLVAAPETEEEEEEELSIHHP